MTLSEEQRRIGDALSDIGILPVIKLEDVTKSAALAEALAAGGVNAAEVTFRAAGADEAIRRMLDAHPDMLVGAGTVLTVGQADRAIEAGARFLVTPGFNRAVVERAIERDTVIYPGVSGTEGIELALSYGLNTVKFFPAEQSGGVAFLKAVAAPYSGIRFLPTGGISIDNLGSYLAFDRVLACGGSFLTPSALLAAGNFQEITRLCRETVYRMLQFSVSGILAPDPGFMGLCVTSDRREIVISTCSLRRALYQIGRQGFAAIAESAERDEKGRMRSVLLAQTFGGFRLKLLQQ